MNIFFKTYDYLIAISGLLVIAIMGGIKAGNSSKVADTVVDGDRLDFSKYGFCILVFIAHAL